MCATFFPLFIRIVCDRMFRALIFSLKKNELQFFSFKSNCSILLHVHQNLDREKESIWHAFYHFLFQLFGRRNELSSAQIRAIENGQHFQLADLLPEPKKTLFAHAIDIRTRQFTSNVTLISEIVPVCRFRLDFIFFLHCLFALSSFVGVFFSSVPLLLDCDIFVWILLTTKKVRFDKQKFNLMN